MTEENTMSKTPELDLSAEAAAEGPLNISSLVPAKRPDITPAQIVGMIPLLAEFGHSFGLFTLSQPQQDSLSKLVVGAVGLFGADALIRLGRNLAHR
jgi:hypothetical protein